MKVTECAQRAVMIELNCETDFVAKTDIFKNATENYLETLLQADDIEVNIADRGNDEAKEKFLSHHLIASLDPDVSKMTAQEGLTHLISKTRENCNLGSLIRQNVTLGKKFGNYLHGNTNGNLCKIGALVLLDSSNHQADVTGIANTLAMHIAAMKPKYISKDRVPSDEKSVKDEELLENQELVSKDATANWTVKDFISHSEKELETEISIEDFALFTLD